MFGCATMRRRLLRVWWYGREGTIGGVHRNQHRQSRLRRPRRLTLLATVFLGTGALVETIALMPAAAAVIPNPVTSITVTPTNPRVIDPVRTDMAWCVPDSTAAGDTFTVALPVQLVQLPHGFP